MTEFIRYRYTAPGELYKALSDKFPGIKLPELEKTATIASPSVSKLLVLTESRERVDSVVRYLVMNEGVDLRRIAAVGMGKVALTAGEKADKDTYAKMRRVEMRLLAPQS